MPKTSSGKIQRHACRDGYLAGTLDVVGQWRAADAGRWRPRPRGRRATPAEAVARAAADPAIPASKNGNGRHDAAANDRLTQLVVEEIRRVAKERADGMTLDSPIVETGLDSLERMEILASLEEKFGGRFPEEILPELETTRQLVGGGREIPGHASRVPTASATADAEIPPATYRFDQFPEYVKLRESLDLLEASGLGNPFFAVHEGLTTRPHDRSTAAS